MNIPNWLRRRKFKTVMPTEARIKLLQNPQREAELHREWLQEQVIMSEDFYRFVHCAHKRGFDADLIVRVDGQSCKTAVSMTSGTCRELFEYLANWAAGERLKMIDRLDGFDSVGKIPHIPPSSGSSQDNAAGPDKGLPGW